MGRGVGSIFNRFCDRIGVELVVGGVSRGVEGQILAGRGAHACMRERSVQAVFQRQARCCCSAVNAKTVNTWMASAGAHAAGRPAARLQLQGGREASAWQQSPLRLPQEQGLLCDGAHVGEERIRANDGRRLRGGGHEEEREAEVRGGSGGGRPACPEPGPPKGTGVGATGCSANARAQAAPSNTRTFCSGDSTKPNASRTNVMQTWVGGGGDGHMSWGHRPSLSRQDCRMHAGRWAAAALRPCTNRSPRAPAACFQRAQRTPRAP